MTDAPRRTLDAAALALFAAKGEQPGVVVPQSGPANGLKVRRVVQLTRDLAGGALDGVRVLDLGCGEGVYAIEAALHGADVVALDARPDRMAQGAACAARHGIAGVRFAEADVRHAEVASLGTFRAVWLLGLLYHLDAPDVFDVLTRLRALCSGFLIVDTLVATKPSSVVEWRGARYEGARVREHGDDDPLEVRRARLLRSIDNTWSFRLTPDALARALHHAGFTAVLQAHVPFEPGKAADRVTLVALAGEPVSLATYPWVNGASEAALAAAPPGEPRDG